MEICNGLVFAVEVTQATSLVEWDSAKTIVERTVTKPGATLGADKNYDTTDFVAAMRQRKVTLQTAGKDKSSAIDR